MGTRSMASWWREVWQDHRGQDLVERTRWLFYICSTISAFLTLGGALSDPAPLSVALAVSSLGVFAVTLTYRHRTRQAPLVLDGLDVLAALVLTMACPQPSMAFGITYAALWFRAVYGRRRDVLLYAVGFSAAMSAALPLWHLVPGHDGVLQPALVLGTLPSLLLNGVIARHMAVGLFARQQAQQRDGALSELGTRLLGVTDQPTIHLYAWEAADRICAATSGLRVVAVTAHDGESLRVVGSAGDFVDLPRTLPGALLPPAAGSEERLSRVDAAPLAGAAGFDGEWVRIPLPEEPIQAVMFVGAPGRIPEDGLVAIRSMVNQVALAMRNSESHRDLAVQALTDSLTGLANRAAFTAALEEAVNAGGDVWAVFVDLDDFKLVNDGMGHSAGDELLRHVAQRLGGAVRGEDLCARLGGDEFAVLLREADVDTARSIAQRLVELSSSPMVLEGRLVRVGASVGIAPLHPGLSAAELIQHADIAMYAAKAAGKNRVQSFQPSLLNVDEEVALENQLRDAVAEEQFTVVYQPILSASDGRCTAVEALVRWDHPTRGRLAPDQFLDVAERTGLIVPLGEQVLRQACADTHRWADAGRDLAIHVNASPSQLAHPGFVPLVRECLAEHGLAPRRLIIEITESSALDSAVAQATLQTLAKLGVGIAVDDFGTGYAALTTLRDLPIDIVKIDRSFVAGAATEMADQVVLRAIAEMAQRMGLQTVAEGVEDADQQQFVTDAGVSAVQGYLHLRPVPADELTAWLARSDITNLAGVTGA